jgi:hypothetical protein
MKKPIYLDESFEQVCQEMLKIFIKKNKDYGKGNIMDTGEMGILFRISDKVNRLKNLIGTGKKPENETKEENWVDIAVYAVIAMLYNRGWFQKLELKDKDCKNKA